MFFHIFANFINVKNELTRLSLNEICMQTDHLLSYYCQKMMTSISMNETQIV